MISGTPLDSTPTPAVHTNRWAEGRDKCIAVYVHLMQGEFDDKLEWFFQGDVHVQLLN